MKLRKINLIIKNVDSPYEYKGTAKEYNDIIEFNDDNINYIYDSSIKRLTKINKNDTIIVDFKNKEIIIKDKEKELRLKMKIIKEKIDNNSIYYSYKIDNDIIEFSLKKEVIL